MQIIGHRGASGYAPENTLKAFELALSQGCEWLELDVHLLDGKLIVIHDEQLDRTTSGQGLISDHSLDAIRRLDAGDGEKVPYLDEVIEMVDGQATINIELKGPGTAQPTSALLDAWCLEHGADPNQFLLSSFNHRELALASPRYARGALFWKMPSDAIDRALSLDARYMNMALKHVTEDWVSAAHTAGLKVAVYTVNEIDDIQRMNRWGVDAIFCDYPDRGFQALE